MIRTLPGLGIIMLVAPLLLGVLQRGANAHEGIAFSANTLEPQVAELEAPHPRVRADSALLLDGVTGEVVVAHKAAEPRAPASLTKILTALVVLERGRLTEMVTISSAAARTRGSRLGLRANQRVSLEDLLAAILIRSANDAAVAAAEHVGGSIRGFVALMNAEAMALGMSGSHFVNPHGLDAPGHVTTARDLGRLAQVALEHPRLAQLVRAREASLTIWTADRRNRLSARRRLLASHNRLLGRLTGADGVKTGYTPQAGRCLVASATRAGRQMIVVLLDSKYRWREATELLEYGFQTRPVVQSAPLPLERRLVAG